MLNNHAKDKIMRTLKNLFLTLLLSVLIVIGMYFTNIFAKDLSGEALFKKHCEACHVYGKNNINPDKPLHRKVLEANNIKTEKDIIGLMRNPGPGKVRFQERQISNENAKKLARYILDTFS